MSSVPVKNCTTWTHHGAGCTTRWNTSSEVGSQRPVSHNQTLLVYSFRYLQECADLISNHISDVMQCDRLFRFVKMTTHVWEPSSLLPLKLFFPYLLYRWLFCWSAMQRFLFYQFFVQLYFIRIVICNHGNWGWGWRIFLGKTDF